MNSHELPPKAEKKEGMAKKFRKLVLPFALLFGAGAGAESPSKNQAEKSGKPVAEYAMKENKVFKSGADTYKSEGNMSMEQVVKEMTGEADKEVFKSDYDIENSRVVKSGADTYKSEGRMSMPPEKK